MIRKIFRRSSIGVGAFILSLAGVLSHIFGVVRDITLSHFFGAGLETDAYATAFLFPDLIFNIFIASSLTGVFLPVFSEKFRKNKKEGEDIAGAFFVFIFMVTFLACVIMFIFIPTIISLFYSDFSPEKKELTINLARILLVSPLLFSVINFFGSILLSQKHFLSYAITPSLYNIGIILGIIIWFEDFGIYSAVFGVIMGLLFYLVIRLLDFLTLDIVPRFNFRFKSLKKIIYLAVPRSLGLMLFQINLWVYSSISAGLKEGSYAAFNYARNIETFPVTIFGISVATASLPFLSDMSIMKKTKDFSERIEKSINQILFFTIPAMVGVSLLSKNIIDTVLRHGKFDQADLLLTSGILLLLAISIPFESVGHLFSQAFFSLQNTIIPLISSVILIVSNLIISFALAKNFGAMAFGIGLSMGIFLKVVFLFLMLKKRISFSINEILISGGKVVLSSIIMGSFISTILLFSPNENLFQKIFFLVFAVIAGFIVFIFSAKILKVKELDNALLFLKNILKIKKQT